MQVRIKHRLLFSSQELQMPWIISKPHLSLVLRTTTSKDFGLLRCLAKQRKALIPECKDHLYFPRNSLFFLDSRALGNLCWLQFNALSNSKIALINCLVKYFKNSNSKQDCVLWAFSNNMSWGIDSRIISLLMPFPWGIWSTFLPSLFYGHSPRCHIAWEHQPEAVLGIVEG